MKKQVVFENGFAVFGFFCFLNSFWMSYMSDGINLEAREFTKFYEEHKKKMHKVFRFNRWNVIFLSERMDLKNNLRKT